MKPKQILRDRHRKFEFQYFLPYRGYTMLPRRAWRRRTSVIVPYQRQHTAIDHAPAAAVAVTGL